MKKNLGLYFIAWAAVLGLFNVIAFLIPTLPLQDKYTPSFWIGYAFISLMIVAQAICSVMAFRADTAKKMFYNISLISTSYIGLIVSLIVGGIFMIFSFLPYWLGIVVCGIILAFNVISVIKASAAISEVVRIDNKIKTQTFFIKSLTVDADTLMAQTKSDVAKAECKKVYEAIRYSDPMSDDALASVEGQITLKFAELSDAVKADDAEKVAVLANEVIILVGDRNKKCKLLK